MKQRKKRNIDMEALMKEQEVLSGRDILAICLYSVLLFFAMTLQSGRMSLVLAVLAVGLSVGKTPLRNFRKRLCVPVIGLAAFALVNGLAAVYSSFGGSAVMEFYKIFASFALMVILLARFEKRHVRGLLWGFAAVCAVISILCIDGACAGGLYDAFAGLMAQLGDNEYLTVVQSSGRVNGIYNDANVTGCILAVSSLVSLYLVQTGKKWWERLAGACLLGVSAQGFFLSLSRGAILCFALSLLVWLIAAGKGERLSLFVLMFFSAGVTLVCSAVSMGIMGEGTVVPDVLALVSGLPIFGLDWIVGRPLTGVLGKHGKVIILGGCALAAACVAFCVVALRTTEPYVFSGSEGEYLFRSLSLEAGEYEISGDWSGAEEAQVLVYSRTEAEALMNRSSQLYYGPLEGAKFTVPEDAVIVFFRILGSKGCELRSVTLSNGASLSLKYKWIPEAIAFRLQDSLLLSYSYLVRVQYMKDALTLFGLSPLAGHGLGSTENLYTSVQPFYYQSLYVHNHILQVMSDMGLLGLAAFLAVLGGGLWLIIKGIKKEHDPLAAMLLAAWVMINSHSLMEINFSIRGFQCAAFLVLLLPVLLYVKPLSEKMVQAGGWILSGFLWVYLAVFGGLLESHRMVQREEAELSNANAYEFLDAVKDFVQRDVFDHDQYKLEFVGNTVILDSVLYNGTMYKYVEDLRDSGTYYACSGLARYYYLPRGEYEEMFACSREGIAQIASRPEGWNNQITFYRIDVLDAIDVDSVERFVEGVSATQEYLMEYSEGRLEEIEISAENRAFLETVSALRRENITAEEMYSRLTG